MKRVLLLFLLVISFVCTIEAQRPQGAGGGKGKGRRGQSTELPVLVKGIVLDQSTGAVIDFATVSIFNADTNELKSGGVTNEKGKFEIETPPGKYYATVEFLSYKTLDIDAFEIKKGKAIYDLGTMQLSEDSKALEEVVVVAEKSQMQLELDKRVFNVGKDVSNQGANTAEILDNLPSVEVDLEGNVSLRGSGNVRILINGKPSGLVGLSSGDALRQLQGDLVEKIEVITNPSARYEAEGNVGIINIILKKGRKKGLNGSFGLTAGYPENFGASYSLNYRRNKVNLFSNFGVSYRNSPGGGFGEFDFANETTQDYDSEQNRIRRELAGNIQLGADWLIDPQSTLTASFLYKNGNRDNTVETFYTNYDNFGEIVGDSIRLEQEDEPTYNLEGALNFEKQFGSRDHKLTLDFRYIKQEDEEYSDFQEGALNENPVLIQRSSNIESEQNTLFQADYIRPLTKNSKFEAGLRANFRSIANDYQIEEEQIDGSYNTLPDFDNALNYTENIFAAYAMYSNKLNKFSYQLGLRGEYSDIETYLVETDERNPRTFKNLFPSVFLSYEMDAKNQFQLSYSRRISRPRFWYLLPFLTFSDTRNLFAGNPDLNPEFTDSYEAGYLRYFEKGSLLSSLYYRHTTGVIERFNVVNPDDGTISRLPINLATENAFGIEFSLSYDLYKWWKLTGNFNFFRAIRTGVYEGQKLESDAYTWTSRINNKMTIFKNIDFQTSLRYRAPSVTTQGRRLSLYSIDTGFSKDVFKGKGTLTLSVRDLFNSRKRRSEVDLPTLVSYSEFQWRARQFLATFNYRINQKKKRGGRPSGGYDSGGGGF